MQELARPNNTTKLLAFEMFGLNLSQDTTYFEVFFFQTHTGIDLSSCDGSFPPHPF